MTCESLLVVTCVKSFSTTSNKRVKFAMSFVVSPECSFSTLSQLPYISSLSAELYMSTFLISTAKNKSPFIESILKIP